MEEERVVQEVTNAPAIGYSVVRNLKGDRQITMQCFIGEQESDEKVNARLDRMMGFIDRQGARYELQDFELELPKRRETLAQFEEDFANVDARFEQDMAEADVQIAELKARAQAIYDVARDAFRISGRRGTFKPLGGDLQNINACDAARKNLEEAKARRANERDQERQNLQISLERHRAGLSNLIDEINIRRRMFVQEPLPTSEASAPG